MERLITGENDQPAVRFIRTLAELQDRLPVLQENIEYLKLLSLSLKELQVMLFTFAEKAQEGLALVQDHKFVWANKAACDITGYTLEELVGLRTREVFIPEERDKAEAITNMLLAGATFEHPLDWTLLKKDRTVRHVKSFGYAVIYCGRPAAQVFFYDVTTDKKLRDELQLQSLLLDSVSDSVFLLNKSGIITYVNKIAYSSRGYARDELIGKSILDITPLQYRRRAEIILSRFSDHKTTRFETAHICKDGTIMPIEVRAKAIRINKVIYFLGVAREKHGLDELEDV